MIKILTRDNKPIEDGIRDILKRVLDKINRDFGKISSKTMTKSVKNWIQQRYPGSTHWDPSKVKEGQSLGVIGTVDVNIAGAGRAYHDVLIRPVKAKALTIPIHQSAYGKKTSDFNDLFRPEGKNYLARNVDGQLIAMFRLAQSAFQKQDKSLMPPDEHLAGGIFKALTQNFEKS